MSAGSDTDKMNASLANFQMPSKNFIPPSEQEVSEQCAKIGLPNREGIKFLAYYETVGWVVGRSKKPVVSWRGCLRTWAMNLEDKIQTENKPSASVESIKNQRALERIEDRIKILRGQAPFPAGDKRLAELTTLKSERTRLMGLIGFMA